MTSDLTTRLREGSYVGSLACDVSKALFGNLNFAVWCFSQLQTMTGRQALLALIAAKEPKP